METLPPKDQKQQVKDIFRHQQLKPLRQKSIQRRVLLKEQELELVSNTSDSLKKYRVKQRSLGDHNENATNDFGVDFPNSV